MDLRAGVRAIPQASANGFGGDSLFNVNLKLNADGIGTLLTYTDSLPVSCTGGISVEGSGCENSVADLRNPFYGSYFTSDAALLANFIRSGASTTFAVNPIADLLLSITACSGANSAGSPIDVTCTGTANLLWEADSDGPNRLPMVGVTYEYIVGVPEPGSMALLGLGLVGLGLARRRRLR